MIRTKGEAGSGNIVEAVRHLRAVRRELRRLGTLEGEELIPATKELQAPFELVQLVAKEGRLPVPNFAAGGVATPADAALCMMLGAESVFVGSGIFKSEDPARRAKAVVKAVANWREPQLVLEASRGLEGAMRGLDIAKLTPEEMLSRRGW
jgi:pyridoxal 5'-phosphate synthase pdxS subunit